MPRERNSINLRTRNQRRISFMELDGKHQPHNHSGTRAPCTSNSPKPAPQAHSER